MTLTAFWLTRVRPGDVGNGRSVSAGPRVPGYRFGMGETEALVEHLGEEHVTVVPDDVRHLPSEQLETVMAALHDEIHDVAARAPEDRGV